MHTHTNSESGVSLVETLIAICVLTIGVVGMGSTFLAGMQQAANGPNELVATQKAQEAMESVFGARDAHTLEWADLRNKANGGVFIDSATTVKLAGTDGIVNTDDDGALEDASVAPFTRKVKIDEITPTLRSVTISITFPSGRGTQTFALTSYISALA